MGIIMFNGVSSKDVGIEVETFPAYNIPEKEYLVYHVLGRNGDIVIETGTYKNVARNYNVSIATWDKVSYSRKINQVAEWLHSAHGYARLEDSYDQDFYRLAYYNEHATIENLFNEAGRGQINFECKPQRFYKKGEIPIRYTSGESSIQNETNFDAKPLIKVVGTGAGSIAIGNYVVGIADSAADTIYIDCERQDAYSFTTDPQTGNQVVVNENANITLVSDFPKIEPGSNLVYITGNITYIDLKPNWWTI